MTPFNLVSGAGVAWGAVEPVVTAPRVLVQAMRVVVNELREFEWLPAW